MGRVFMEFTFSTDIIERVVQEIEEAKEYVRIAVFQIHNEAIYDALDHVLRNGIVVEIFTLPYDSINEDIRDKVKDRIEKIKTYGAKVYFSKWGIGDPERTTTAVGRWYSFHGKFLVTDNVAISLSANLTEESELDAMLVYKEQKKINEFNAKFQTLLMLFERGNIKSLVEQTEYDNKDTLFLAPRTITEPEVRSHWIRDYPSEMCGNNTSIEDRLYIAPIECRARELWETVIKEANEYVYISTESFTDTAIIPFLITNSIEGKVIKILTGSESQDFTERIRELYPRLMANNIELRKPNHPLHAKLIITDKRLVVSSVNLNKMNLGYAKKKTLWRANTETITIESDPNTIRKAKADYDKIFNDSNQLLTYLSDKEVDYAISIFTVYGVKPDRNVKNLLSQVIVKSDIKLKRNLYQIGRYASILIKKFNKSKPIIETSDFLCAMVLYYLSDRKHTEPELKEKLSEIFPIIDDGSIIEKLLQYKLIIKEEEFFKLDLKTLIGEVR
jgi:phosphatidylserine/phosphatidylglycerophosphate/cardiolipin synthase-like enzyme